MRLKATLIAVLTILTVETFGCVCRDWAIMPPIEDKHLYEADYQILTGKVLDIQAQTVALNSDTTGLSDYEKSQKRTYYLVTISIIKNYGSKIKIDTIDIATGISATMDCGFPFKKNKEYLITLATKDEDQDYYWTSICVPTKYLSGANEDIEFIEKNKK